VEWSIAAAAAAVDVETALDALRHVYLMRTRSAKNPNFLKTPKSESESRCFLFTHKFLFKKREKNNKV
jgi:hypothetical protein